MSQNREIELLENVPMDGSGIGNGRLLRALGWDEEEFWEVRNRLVDRGILELGRGRGGSVRRVPVTAGTLSTGVPPSEIPPPETPQQDTEARAPEADLYPPLMTVLSDRWIKDKRVENAIVQLTAVQGRRATGGKWTRPDISVATLSTYPYVPGRHFDVITFEVKPSDTIDVTAVYEALAHLRSATRAYVLLHVPDALVEELDEVVTEICAEAKKHGIGVITFADPEQYDTWDERVEPIRREPEPRKLNDFLATQFTQEQREKIVKWFR